MGRTVISQQQALAATPNTKPDDYKQRLLKYIPTEVIALYLTLDTLVRSSDDMPSNALWIIFAIGLVGTFLYLWRVEKVRKAKQLIISTIAFAVWVFALGGPFTALPWYEPLYAAILLPLYTFFIPIIEA